MRGAVVVRVTQCAKGPPNEAGCAARAGSRGTITPERAKCASRHLRANRCASTCGSQPFGANLLGRCKRGGRLGFRPAVCRYDVAGVMLQARCCRRGVAGVVREKLPCTGNRAAIGLQRILVRFARIGAQPARATMERGWEPGADDELSRKGGLSAPGRFGLQHRAREKVHAMSRQKSKSITAVPQEF